MSSNTLFSHNNYLVRRKIFKLFGAAFHIYDSEGNLAFYSKMKAFKMKEDIRLYSSEDMLTEVLSIKARSIIMKSILKDEWIILDAEDNQIGFVKEDSALLAIIRRFLTTIIPQKYHGELNGEKVCEFKQNFNPFVVKINLDYSMDTKNLLDRRLGIAAAVLLCAIEGKQS